MAVIVPFESPSSIDRLVNLVAPDMERVNHTIIARTGSEVTMIPQVANHLISSGGKRLRPILTLAMAKLSGYGGDGHIKLAASVEFMHTATLLHDDVVDGSELRRGRLAARMLWGNESRRDPGQDGGTFRRRVRGRAGARRTRQGRAGGMPVFRHESRHCLPAGR